MRYMPTGTVRYYNAYEDGIYSYPWYNRSEADWAARRQGKRIGVWKVTLK